MNTVEKCLKCTGIGSNCSDCGGTGIVSNSRNLTVKIPKGVKEGQKIRLKGEGKQDNYGRKGDLYFTIKFKDINEAYEVLSDREKKSRYDSLGANWQQGANFTPPPGFEGFNFNNFNQGGFSQSIG